MQPEKSKFQLTGDERCKLVRVIIGHVPKGERTPRLMTGVLESAHKYPGMESRVLDIMERAARRGRLPEYIERFAQHYEDHFRYVLGRTVGNGFDEKTGGFFDGCDSELNLTDSESSRKR